MKKKDFEKLRKLGLKELKEELIKTRKDLVDLKMAGNREKTKDVRLIGKKRDEIARMMTILKEKQLMEEVKDEEI